MRVGIAIAVLAGAGFALAQAGRAPELRAVSAPADGIVAPSGALLAAAEFDGPAHVGTGRHASAGGAAAPARRGVRRRLRAVA
jgi:hypothetical protein